MSEVEAEKVLLQAKKRAEELDLETVVVASSSGKTGFKVAELFMNVTFVSLGLLVPFKPQLYIAPPKTALLFEKVMFSKVGLLSPRAPPLLNIAPPPSAVLPEKLMFFMLGIHSFPSPQPLQIKPPPRL